MAIRTLIADLQTIPDWRRQRAVQHPLWLLLLLNLLGVMSGYSSLRGLSDFAQRHYLQVAELFGVTARRAPSYSTLRKVAHYVSGAAVVRVFQQWVMQDYTPAAGVGIALDGKALASTMQDYAGEQQDFVTVVSAGVHDLGVVIGQTAFHNGETSEIEQVRQLLQQLDVRGAWFTLDALHTQKKR